MKVAVLIACHKDSDSVFRLCSFFSEIEDFICIVHVDRKSNMDMTNVLALKNVVLVPDHMRVDVKWGSISQVEATLVLMECARKHSVDYFWFMSGQDYPIKSRAHIKNFFLNSSQTKDNFLDIRFSNFFRKRNAVYYPKFVIGPGSPKRILRVLIYFLSFVGVFRRRVNFDIYHGSCWFCFHSTLVDELFNKNVLQYYLRFFRNSFCPDESFFQTVVINEINNTRLSDYLVYVDWSRGGANPKVLTIEDFDKIITSTKLVARKFDYSVDRNIVDRLSNYFVDKNS